MMPQYKLTHDEGEENESNEIFDDKENLVIRINEIKNALSGNIFVVIHNGKKRWFLVCCQVEMMSALALV